MTHQLGMPLEVLLYFLENPGKAINLFELSLALHVRLGRQIKKSTLHRYLQLLVDKGFLTREAKNYKLQPKILRKAYDYYETLRKEFLKY